MNINYKYRRYLMTITVIQNHNKICDHPEHMICLTSESDSVLRDPSSCAQWMNHGQWPIYIVQMYTVCIVCYYWYIYSTTLLPQTRCMFGWFVCCVLVSCRRVSNLGCVSEPSVCKQWILWVTISIYLCFSYYLLMPHFIWQYDRIFNSHDTKQKSRFEHVWVNK